MSSALYGFLFTEDREAAFANYHLWETLGFLMAMGYQNTLKTKYKLCVSLVFLLTGMLGYALLEILEARKVVRSKSHTGAGKRRNTA